MSRDQKSQGVPPNPTLPGDNILSFLPISFDPALLDVVRAGTGPARQPLSKQQQAGSAAGQRPPLPPQRGQQGSAQVSGLQQPQQLLGRGGSGAYGQLQQQADASGGGFYDAGGAGWQQHYSAADSTSRGSGRGGRGRGRGGRGRRGGSSDEDEDYVCEEELGARGSKHSVAVAAAVGQPSKRRRKEPKLMEAQAQLLLLGFLSSVVDDNDTLKQSLVTAVQLDTQQQLAVEMEAAATGRLPPGPEPGKMGLLQSYQLAQKLSQDVRGRAALSLVWQLPLSLTTARGLLMTGGPCTLEDVTAAITDDCRATLTSFDFSLASMRRSKVEGQFEALAEALPKTVEELLVEAGHIAGKTKPHNPHKYVTLPRCIADNKEPFAHKDWRQQPFEPRPYVVLSDYAITTNVPEEAAQIKAKLSTRRRDGAGDFFREKHTDLSDAELAQQEQHLVQQVLARKALKMNHDVIEVDTWGMDCYTRRNVFDAVLEAHVFKHLRYMPDKQQQPAEQEQQQQQEESQAQLSDSKKQQQQQQEQHLDVKPEPDAAAGAAADQAQAMECSPPPEQQQQQKQEEEAPPAEGAEKVEQSDAPGERGEEPEQHKPHLAAKQQQDQEQQGQEQQEEQEQPVAAAADEDGCEAEGGAVRRSKRPRRRSSQAGEEEAVAQPAAAAAEAAAAAAAAGGAAAAAGAASAAAAGGGGLSRSSSGAVVVAPGSRPPFSRAEEDAVHEWIDNVFIPAVNRCGDEGWDITRVTHSIRAQAEVEGDRVSAAAARAILQQFERLGGIGYNYFRLHPKGRGVVVTRPAGLPAFTFVEEYFGELHTGWRWFELQDAIKRITRQELPDFYNIALERPKDDPDGYDVLFVDAAFMGSFASRMSHSCTPNCQAVVVSCGGKLTVALYTIRPVMYGEELTFDYSCVTESEDEFKQAFCMCSTRHCRGSYLYYTGSKTFMQVIERCHTFLDRQVLLLEACSRPLTPADRARLDAAGLRGAALGRPDTPANPELPDWTKKWAALVLQFVDLERQLLPGELQALPPPLTQSPADSVANAVGVELNRLQNICITLDKAKHCLNQPGQCRAPPLALLSDSEVAEHLWNGERSVVKRAIKAASAAMLPTKDAAVVMYANTNDELTGAAGVLQYQYPLLAALLSQTAQPVADADAARAALLRVVDQLREIDVALGGGHTRACDVLLMYALTKVWFAASRDYASFSSLPLQLHEEMIDMHGGLDHNRPRRSGSGAPLPGRPGPSTSCTSGAALGPGDEQAAAGAAAEHDAAAAAAALAAAAAAAAAAAEDEDEEYDPTAGSDDEEGGRGKGGKKGRKGAKGGKKGPACRPVRDIDKKILEKRYGPMFVWAQLSGWYKQTVYEPTASLSADRRGTVALPDVEGCYNSKEKYDARERVRLIAHIQEQPERAWTSSAWSFRNESKVFGSPMFDAFWGQAQEGQPREGPLVALAAALKAAPVPWGAEGEAEGTSQGKGKKSKKRSGGGGSRARASSSGGGAAAAAGGKSGGGKASEAAAAAADDGGSGVVPADVDAAGGATRQGSVSDEGAEPAGEAGGGQDAAAGAAAAAAAAAAATAPAGAVIVGAEAASAATSSVGAAGDR